MKHLEVLIDKGSFGKQCTVLHRGQRFFEDDDEAAEMLVKLGRAKYVEEAPRYQARVMTTESADALLEPRGQKHGRYGRRDLRARD